MNNNDILDKFTNNKKVLFIIPHLIYIIGLINSYCLNKNILFLENIFILLVLFFLFTCFLQFLLNRIVKNRQYVFYAMFFLCFIYLMRFRWYLITSIIIFIIVSLFVIIRYMKNSFNTIIGILIFFVCTYFLMTTPMNIYLIAVSIINSESYEDNFVLNIDDNNDLPNIYWIHCDAMMSFDTVKKYFGYDNVVLASYFDRNGFYYNRNASLIVGHKTQNALAALYNPNFYDNLYRDYLYELEDVYLENDISTSFYVMTEEVVHKRFDNELMSALKKKGYTTVGISKFNNYSSMKTDVFYDFYNFDYDNWHTTKTKYLRRIADDSNKNFNYNYRVLQLENILSSSIFSIISDRYIPFDYELIDYNDLDTSNYPSIDKTSYWQAKAILKSIEEAQNINSNKFFFIDYDLNHTEFSFDMMGNRLSEKESANLNNLVGNYIYSSVLLIDMVNYIKDTDKDAVIILQGDHGLHTGDNEILMDGLNISNKELQDIRNSVINAVLVPDKYQNGDEEYLSNPLNISRYLINNFVGDNYSYIEEN